MPTSTGNHIEWMPCVEINSFLLRAALTAGEYPVAGAPEGHRASGVFQADRPGKLAREAGSGAGRLGRRGRALRDDRSDDEVAHAYADGVGQACLALARAPAP